MSETGELSFRLEMRIFAPFDSFGHGFKGDNRGFSVSDNSSRLRGSVSVNVRDATISKLEKSSDLTVGPVELAWPVAAAHSKPQLTVSSQKLEHGAAVDMHLSGSNPLLRGAPDIDNRAQVSLEQLLPGVVKVTAVLSGDKFPANELVLRDSAGRGLFLGGFMPNDKGDVWTKLWGNADRPESKLQITATVDGQGHWGRVLSAELTTPVGVISNLHQPNTTFTLEGWNSAARTVLTPDHMPAPEPERIENKRDQPHQNAHELSTPTRGKDGMGL
jgi:hypothetical protein